MLHLFLNPSPLLAAGEFLVGVSLPMFAAALVAAFGERIKLSWGRGGDWRPGQEYLNSSQQYQELVGRAARCPSISPPIRGERRTGLDPSAERRNREAQGYAFAVWQRQIN
jgi:hypothetical protein